MWPRTFVQVPFLNLVANLQERAGYIFVRLGGNTQEDAAMVFTPLDNGRNMEKANRTNLDATVRNDVLDWSSIDPPEIDPNTGYIIYHWCVLRCCKHISIC